MLTFDGMVFEKNLRSVQVNTSQLFFWILLGQWALSVVLALALSPSGWTGRTRSLHSDVEMAILLGGLVNALPLALLRARLQAAAARACIE